MVKPDNSLIGSAGVHFVCGELCRRGYTALPTIRNTPGIDIITKTPEGKKIELQVKISWNENEWFCPIENKIKDKEDFFFIFVNLREESENPLFYIVPSKIVKEQAEKGFKAWLETPGKKGKPHDPNNKMRKFPPIERRFKSEAYKKYLGSPLNLNQFKEWSFQ